MTIKIVKENRFLITILTLAILLAIALILNRYSYINLDETEDILFSLDRYFTIKVFLLSSAIIFFISGKIFSSLMTSAFIFVLILACSHFKIYYLGNALTLADLIFFLSDISENIVLFKTYKNLGLLLSAALIFITVVAFVMFRKEKYATTKFRWIGFSVAILLGANQAYAIADSRASRVDVFNLSPDQLGGNAAAAYFSLVKQNSAPLETSPSGLKLIDKFFLTSSTDFEKPVRVKQTIFQRPSQKSALQEQVKPDILVVLNESLFNPALLSQCEGEKVFCDSKLFQKQKLFPGVYGPMSVHTHGGGTWLSEFAFLSGYDWRTYGPGGAFAPRNIAPHLNSTIAKHLQSLGYRTVAVYPVAGNFLSARKAYEHYGFDEFYDTEDLGISDEWRNTSDTTVFEKALNVLKNKADSRPVFLFILTIKNHGPYTTNRNLVNATEIGKSLRSSSFSPPLIDYLTRMRETEFAIESLRKSWLSTEKPRLFAWFGDHQPFLAGYLSFSKQSVLPNLPPELVDEKKRLLTWYEITSNNPKRLISQDPHPTDLAFFGTKLLEYAELPLLPHGEATLAISKQCMLGITSCNNDLLVKSYLSFRVWELGEIR